MSVRTHKFSTGVFKIDAEGELHGYCESPEHVAKAPKHRQIWINPDLSGLDRLETIIHESLHAEYPQMREKTVADGGHNIARLLWRLGYRDGET